MKVAVRFTDGTKQLLDDHSDIDNTAEVATAIFRQEYIKYIENLLRKKIQCLLFETILTVENIRA